MRDTDESEDDRVRAELVAQLRESLARSREMMLNQKLDPQSRERWTQKHTNTAQVLNEVLKERQLRNWERRLHELEARGFIPRGTIHRLETSRALTEKKETDVSSSSKPQAAPEEERPE